MLPCTSTTPNRLSWIQDDFARMSADEKSRLTVSGLPPPSTAPVGTAYPPPGSAEKLITGSTGMPSSVGVARLTSMSMFCAVAVRPGTPTNATLFAVAFSAT